VGPDSALQMLTQLLWNSFLIASPVLFVTLGVGVVISLLQVITQLQEMSLSYVPKLIAAGLTLVIAGPWMLNRLGYFAASMFKEIPNLG